MNKEVEDHINKQRSPEREICKTIRKLIHQTIPRIKEEMKWGAIVFAGGKFYIGILKDHINIGFSIKGLSAKEAAMFEGSGRTMRHIKIRTMNDIDEEKLVRLFRLVNRKSKCEEKCD